ncbi:Hint domain protein [Roseovarius mucosus DSM 17069]|uniref:Hint domain protein n=1 Tax=Roseovarius mucosus DSM 17069 TaxID=1288298 RepID=A0A0A0HS51_9RHOB|nr:choice-of-anchor L domain-containing protein [Roseovarius mucosus]KGM88878.1 Hint domain protein [Roseovarius mucosus DSM 17069]
MATASELPIDTSASAMDMAVAMFGHGITIVSASYTGAASASGIYSDGDTVSPDLTPSDTGVILSTGSATDVTNEPGLLNLLADPNLSAETSTDHALAGDADMTAISGQETFDAAVFEAEFIPEGSTLTMQIVFSSEEYLEYVNAGFNDAVGVWVNGVQAELTVGTGDITINNINDVSNANLYMDNSTLSNAYNTEMDGFTVTLTLKAPVVAGEVNTIKIGIADGGDGALDSNLLIAGNSIQTSLIAEDDVIDVTRFAPVETDLLANDTSAVGGTLTITEVNGQPVVVGDTITLATGETLQMTATGFVLVTSAEAVGTSNVLSYTVADEFGNTDVGFITLNTVAPCFTEGTLIDTPKGPVAIEALRPGDLVQTLDHGPQPLRWIGRSPRRARGGDAPVALAANALGRHAALELSANHRILVASPQAELLFGTHQVLVKAAALVNDHSITRRCDGAPVVYVHLLFDRHEIVRGNGLWSESYHPGPMTQGSFDAETEAELHRLFPEVFASGAAGYGPSARSGLRSHEAQVLVDAMR